MAKVLLVENSRTARYALTQFLQGLGHEVVAVGFGQEAIDAVAQAPTDFALIIMDIYMPRMNGHEASKLLRDKGITTPIVAYTASTDPRDKTMCLSAGMNDFIQKSEDHATLATALTQLLH
jgi:CheY-like chemotaxis protein